jgi:D-3-phosphoglycerate dehydrogenase
MTKVLIADQLSPAAQNELTAAGAVVDFQPSLTAEDLPLHVADTEVLIVRSTKVTAETIAAGKHLTLIVRAGAGVNTIDLDAASDQGIYVANCPGKNKNAVSELTIGLLIACDRQIPSAHADMQQGRWLKKKYGKAKGLSGRTLGILGLGQIGQEVAVAAQGLGMLVVGWSRSLTPAKAAELEIGYCSSPLEVAKRCDALTVHVAAGTETKHLINAELLAALPDGSIFINAARGDVMDTAAVKAAIQSKGLKVGLDVFENEPSGGEADFQDTELANLAITTPHIGASSDQAADAIAMEVSRIFKHFLQDGSPPNCVNLATPVAKNALIVRHLNKVGVLAAVLDHLRAAAINVEQMQNTIFSGGKAATCTLLVDQPIDADVQTAISGVEYVLQVDLK